MARNSDSLPLSEKSVQKSRDAEACVPIHSEVSPAEAVPGVNKKINRAQVLGFTAFCWSEFLIGWNDATYGPLIPRIQSHYHVSYTVVSLMFLLSCIGGIFGALTYMYSNRKVKFGKLIIIAAVPQVITYAIQATAPPFPLFLVAPILSGYGMSLQSANMLVYALQFDDIDRKVSIIQATYGLGAAVAPLGATVFATKKHWSFFYFASMSGATVTVILFLLVFRLRDLESIIEEAGGKLRTGNTKQENAEKEKSESQKSPYIQIIGLRAVQYLAVFAILYVGVEVTLGGWTVTYIIHERNGGSSSGYITSGIYGGLGLGRIFLVLLHRKIGEHNAMRIYIALCIILTLVVWFVPSLVGDAVAISFVGLFFGPMYPLIITTAERVVPPSLIPLTVSLIGIVGQAGAAIFPFIAGLMATKAGVASLMPLTIGILVVMGVTWILVTQAERKIAYSDVDA